MYTGVYSGFTDLDNELLSLLTSFIGLKITQIEEYALSKEKDKKVIEIVGMVSTLLMNRNCIKLLRKLRKVLPSLLGYEYVGVYLHNPDSTSGIKLR